MIEIYVAVALLVAVVVWWATEKFVESRRWKAYAACNIQADGTRMCATCWRAAVEDLPPGQLRRLVASYAPARAAVDFWGNRTGRTGC